MIWESDFYGFKFKWTATAGIGPHLSKNISKGPSGGVMVSKLH